MNYRPSDIMTIAIARMLKNDETVFHGVASPLPMVAIQLAKSLQAPDLIYVNITGGVDAKPLKFSKSTDGPELLKGTKALFPLSEIFDLSMRGGLDVAFLSGIQFDSYGNVNASVVGDYHKPKVRLPGGAGSAVLIPTAKRAIIWRTKHDKRTFVPKCDFVTTRGNIHKIVTPLCIFAFKDGRLVLDSIHKTSSLQEVIDNTGFEVVYDKIRFTEDPTPEELKMLQKVDPTDIRSIEF
ncbi:CoA-transferase subunit beta [Desnuesiella massiliensis]|uniref:CoA-transferase subunit beta n=1 Tax=Desnuesiella massiliensis TaxID=1650662 RepID=UPI0006E2ECA7|nr:CoA-transferase [Desnuesiella massiliensis]